MAAITLTDSLRREYETLFNTCVIPAARTAAVETIIAQLLANRSRYQSVAGTLGIPWFFIAVIHNMESTRSFAKHLHNGDPLTARTVQVPAGRPRTGNPPFTWEESALDALSMRKLNKDSDWSLAGLLYQVELYNGWGYRRFHPDVLSPYLWSYSDHYTSGKYVADGTWSITAKSNQCGAAVLLRRLAETGEIEFPDQPAPAAASPAPLLQYAIRKSADTAIVARITDLQNWLNGFPGIFVKVDAVPGKQTSDAYKAVTGHYLSGDPRN